MPAVIGEKREGGGRLRSRNGLPVFEETYNYLVLADSVYDDRLSILTTTGLPQLNVSTSAGGFAVCRGLNAVKDQKNNLYWHVTAEFSSEVEDGNNSQTNPTNDPPEAWVPIYETKFERYQQVVTTDQAGNKFVNSAGQPFDTGLTVTRHIPIWEFYQFEPASVSDETVIGRSEVVNSGTFKGRAAKTLLCVVLSSVIGRFYGQLRRLTQYQLKYNKDDWRIKMLDMGTRHNNAGGTATVPYNAKILASGGYTGDNLELILGPLNGSGNPAGGFDGATDFAVMDGTEPAILQFDQYASVDFSTFLRV